MMQPHRVLTTLLAAFCVACGAGDSEEQIPNTQALGVDTSKVAGFWDFSSTDPDFPDEQYVELTTDGQWNVYARFPDDPDTQNCYDRQVTVFNPIGNDMYSITTQSGQILEVGLDVVDNELAYTLTRSDESTTRAFMFPSVQGLSPMDLPVCG